MPKFIPPWISEVKLSPAMNILALVSMHNIL